LGVSEKVAAVTLPPTVIGNIVYTGATTPPVTWASTQR
jgi:hypothetical protein